MNADQSNLINPEEIVANRGREIGDLIKSHSVAIIMYAGKVIQDSYRALASGALIRIQNRQCILSAGHCVEGIQRSEYSIVIPITNSRHIFNPRIVNSNYQLGNDCDWGYIEIAQHDAATMEANRSVFMNLDRVQIINIDDIALANDWFILSGYPRELAQVNDQGVSVQFSHISTKSSHSENSPKSPTTSENEDMPCFYLVLRLDSAVDNVSGNQKVSFVPGLGGASGGGCWRLNTYPVSKSWDPSCLRLVGVHQGSTDKEVINGIDYVFARQVSIEHHLSLISHDYVDLRKEIIHRWPNISRQFS